MIMDGVKWASTVRVPKKILLQIMRAAQGRNGLSSSTKARDEAKDEAKIEFSGDLERIVAKVSVVTSPWKKQKKKKESDDAGEGEGGEDGEFKKSELNERVIETNDDDDDDDDDEKIVTVASFESRKCEVAGDLCEMIVRNSNKENNDDDGDGDDGTDERMEQARVIARLECRFHPTRDDFAKERLGKKCKTRTSLLVRKKNEKFNTKMLSNYERMPEEDALVTTTTTTMKTMVAKVVNDELATNGNTNTNSANNAIVPSIGSEELDRMAKKRISLVRATILLAESKNSETFKASTNAKTLATATVSSEVVCRECIISLLHERQLSKDALREAIVRGFENATKISNITQEREQILETPLRDTFERALKEVATFRAPGRYEMKRDREEEGKRANASALLWIAQEQDVDANVPIVVVNRKRVRSVAEIENDAEDLMMELEREEELKRAKNGAQDVLTPPLLLESRNKEKEEAVRKETEKNKISQVVSPLYEPEDLLHDKDQTSTSTSTSSSSSDDDDDDDDDDDEISSSSGLSSSSEGSSDSDDSSDSESESRSSEDEEDEDTIDNNDTIDDYDYGDGDDDDTEWMSFESEEGKQTFEIFKQIGSGEIKVSKLHVKAWNLAFEQYWSIRNRLDKYWLKLQHFDAKKHELLRKKRPKRELALLKQSLKRFKLAWSIDARRERMLRISQEINECFGGKTREKVQEFLFSKRERLEKSSLSSRKKTTTTTKKKN